MNKNLKILAQNIKGLTYDETMELTRYLAEFVGDIPHEELDRKSTLLPRSTGGLISKSK